jgi:cell wall-associated NlpC family hydrolase
MEKTLRQIVCILFLLLSNTALGTVKILNTTSIPPQELQNFSDNPNSVKKLIRLALDLATKNLGYLYGSADTKNGGMDCSGTIYYLLNQIHVKEIPRSSESIYQWVREKGNFHSVSTSQLSSPELSNLQPGYLLFWSGTYNAREKVNATHVMLYLGKNKSGEPLMIGSSDGRTYKGRKVYGVSVFDFQLPNASAKSKFLGYSCIPDINCSSS